jgi:ribosomal protein L37AE/L43A
MTKPNCPKCRRKLFVNRTPDGQQWFCSNCKGTFEDDNEGGDYCADPTRRIEREEERAAREAERRKERRYR